MTETRKAFSLQRRTTKKVLVLSLGIILIMAIISFINFLEIYGLTRANTLRIVITSINHQLATVEPEKYHSNLKQLTQNYPMQDSLSIRVWKDGQTDSPVIATGVAQSHWNALPKWILERKPSIGHDFIGDRELEIGGREFEIIWSRRAHNDQTYNILVLYSDQEAREQAGWILIRFVLLTLCAILVATVTSFFLVRGMLTPLKSISEHCDGINQGSMQPLSLENPTEPVELEPLVSTLNRMLARLEKVMQRQRQFAADASHELRTPLAIAKSTLQLAVSKRRTETDYLASIHETLENLSRIERLCGQLIDLTRLDHENDFRHFKKHDLCDAINEAIQLTITNPNLHHPEILWEPGEPVIVLGNRTQLCRLFQNLLENAIKYGPKREPVHVSIDSESDEVHVRIIDRGGQIPPEVLPKLFDRFYRDDPSRTRDSGGSGLGLAIAREIAKLHEGDLSISSDPQTGTIVTMWMPIR